MSRHAMKKDSLTVIKKYSKLVRTFLRGLIPVPITVPQSKFAANSRITYEVVCEKGDYAKKFGSAKVTAETKAAVHHVKTGHRVLLIPSEGNVRYFPTRFTHDRIWLRPEPAFSIWR